MSEDTLLRLKNKVQVGKVRDSHGLKGELFIITSLSEPPPWLEKITTFTLEFKNPTEQGKHLVKAQDFTIKKTRPHKKGFIVKTDELQSRNESDVYIGAGFYIDGALLESKAGEKLYLRELKGCEVFDGSNSVGNIVSFGTNNAQDLLIVETNNGLQEIPFVDAFIDRLEIENKKVFLKLPDGLLNLDSSETPDDEDN